jgi:hypothetical protein
MTRDPQLVPRDALSGVRVALSVSESADLPRLGLDPVHLELTIAELTRAIVIAGGTVVYGGRIDEGFTRIVQEQSERYARDQLAFEHLVPYSEHAHLPLGALRDYEAGLGVHSAVLLLDAEGSLARVTDSAHEGFPRADIEPGTALTVLRRLLATRCDTRVVVGGRLSGYAGTMPGVIEESVLTLKQGKPLYVAGGFGGAAAFVGRALAPELYAWLPMGMPANVDLEVLDGTLIDFTRQTPCNGLTPQEQAVLAATNRPSDVATLAVLGMSRLRIG